MSTSADLAASFNPFAAPAKTPGPITRQRRPMRAALAVTVIALLALSACSGDATTTPGVSGSTATPGGDGLTTDAAGEDVTVIDPGDDVVLTSGLVRFNDCDALLGYLHDEYSERVGPWGLDDDVIAIPLMAEDDMFDMGMADEDMAVDADMAFSDAPSSATEAGAPAPEPVEGVDFSGTNVQEQGVDEADIIKTDGNRIFTLSSGRLVVVDAGARRELGSVELADGWSTDMFIHGDSVLIVQTSHDEATWRPSVVLQRVEAPQGAAPRVVQTMHVEGQYLSARSVAGTARIVIRHDPHHDFPFVYPQGSAGEERAKQSNIAAVRESTLDDWLPNYSSDAAGLSEGALLGDCADVHAPFAFSGFGITAVMSVPVNAGLDGSAATMVTAPGDTVYASTQSLYVATTLWGDPETFEDDSDWEQSWWDRSTSLHRFDISDASTVVYEASGDVDGEIHNQFSLSEHAGHLRVVTTTGGPWGEDSQSQVRVLRQDGSRLIEVGSVGDIGKGEDVQSVRFVGDVGYVVTFRQIDPFYTIDLSDPANPAILGELKIPGFSSYLHPISDTMVLGVGSDADLDGRVTGSKVSLFDVSDLSAPLEVAVWTAPDGWNDIGWDHRAFLWWAPSSMAVIPVSVYSYSPDIESWSGAVVLHVADGTITERGRIEHDRDQEIGQTECRRITDDDRALPLESDSDLAGDIPIALFYDENAVIACLPGQMPTIEGYSCNWWLSADEIRQSGISLEQDEDAIMCWPMIDDFADPIVRSLVIDDELWTLSYTFDRWDYRGTGAARLQANDLETLQRLAALEL